MYRLIAQLYKEHIGWSVLISGSLHTRSWTLDKLAAGQEVSAERGRVMH